ncbi:MAG: BolA family transcriptional regulator [Gammaproteobacteria bacterium]|nr:BolA family transcriptional regulator [Gammaproteobacteria bacterium]
METQATITNKLTEALAPDHLEVINESHMHNVPAGSESHFKVILVSPKFAQVTRVKRHQMVYQVLSEELAGGVHALALHTYAPAEWDAAAGAPDSPRCLGGSKA